MGYDFHITRAGHWYESAQHPFSRAEWTAAVRRRPERSTSKAAPTPHLAAFIGGGDPDVRFHDNEAD